MNKIQKLFFGYQDVPHVFFLTFFFFSVVKVTEY